ncbi:thiamine phosphate synthase [Malaciobacter molluscorum LMG 25693]|uniref:Thiamine phosphate synthase n=1 Tax=Malaciobacter molluscorum LMG 25693 TaxID=870501 RepID=A0A2G1DK26_9BACT|nr:thiamine phosphate synthase [Malaciobacter molluscorum]AXX91365.1 thiamine phosphate synthase (TMP-TENI domain) [Malaciobacter molluscorum LMG 25693]PHO18883.1 thiamine phosphate synthase [Malaciobacter molluscorum LMG 25693]
MKKYLITDPKYYSDNTILFRKNLTRVLKNHKVDIACFRDKISHNYEDLAKVFIDVCNEFKIETTLINSHINLAKQLKATGVHLTSDQFNQIKEAKENDLYTIISCHNYNDIEKAQSFYANCVTYSPIFNVANKGEPKGIHKLKEAIKIFEDIDIIALGGITTKEDLKKVAYAKPYGFASIRYFI